MVINRRKRRNTIEGYLFILPNLIGFLVFTLFSVVFSAVISFTNWDMITGFRDIEFIGIKNYIELFTDNWFIESVLNNLFFIAFIPLYLFVALIVATILNGSVYFSKIIRTIIYLPQVTNVVIVSLLWSFLLRPNGGIINNLLMAIGIANPPQWFGSIFWVKPALVLIMLWSGLGYNTLLYLGGLQSISKDLYEAADIDGASKVRQFFSITIPMVSPTTFFMLIMGLISSFQMWSNVQILTSGGPGTASTVIGFYIYRTAFRYGQMGYASSMAWVLFVFVLIITLFQWHGQKKWVNYI
jgi:multiple sugar transport system permease protein